MEWFFGERRCVTLHCCDFLPQTHRQVSLGLLLHFEENNFIRLAQSREEQRRRTNTTHSRAALIRAVCCCSVHQLFCFLGNFRATEAVHLDLSDSKGLLESYKQCHKLITWRVTGCHSYWKKTASLELINTLRSFVTTALRVMKRDGKACWFHLKYTRAEQRKPFIALSQQHFNACTHTHTLRLWHSTAQIGLNDSLNCKHQCRVNPSHFLNTREHR